MLILGVRWLMGLVRVSRLLGQLDLAGRQIAVSLDDREHQTHALVVEASDIQRGADLAGVAAGVDGGAGLDGKRDHLLFPGGRVAQGLLDVTGKVEEG